MSLRVVVADDSGSMRARVVQTLQAIKGVEIISQHENGSEAMKAIRATHPHLAILDCMMPHLTGIEAATMIREEGIPTAILLCSSVAQKCTMHGFELLVKPFHKRQMEQSIYNIFGTINFEDWSP